MSTTETKPRVDETLFVKMALDAWNFYNKRMNELLEQVNDEQMLRETSAGRNTGLYLFGHLTAVSDRLQHLLGFGEVLYPELEKPFITSPDKAGHEMPSAAELRQKWNTVNEKLNQHISTLQPIDWFTKHGSVSAEDFVKEPHRNRLNLLISRTNHLCYHLGQLVYIRDKKNA